jgi:hypothetical protein
MDKYTRKLEIFKQSYQEVLAALKHQDDKLNRILTALAFLTVAGVALFSRVTGPNNGLTLGDSGPGAPVVLFVVFLIAVAIGVIVTLTAIGPGSPLHQASTPEQWAKLPKSLIFYALIARNEKWGKRFDEPADDLEKELARNYHQETRQIARRVVYKVVRAREAVAWVQLAIVALALMGIFGAIGLSATTRWWVASGLLVVVLAIPLWDLVTMVDARYIDSNYSALAYAMLAAATAMAAGFLVTGDLADSKWEALAYAAVVFIVPRYAIVRPKQTHALLILGLLAAIPTVLLMIF